jgi:hypothetical protein
MEPPRCIPGGKSHRISPQKFAGLAYRLWRTASGRDPSMPDETVVTLKLNQQQLELVDRTVARGVAPDGAALVRLALREYAAAHLGRLATEERSPD